MESNPQASGSPSTGVAPEDLSERKSPRDKLKFWQDEVKNSTRRLREFRRQGTQVTRRFLDDRGTPGMMGLDYKSDTFRLNLFHGNVKTLQDLLYGQLPTVEASRQHTDADDDVARVAAEVLQRTLNIDIADHGQDYDSILRATLQDRLLPGLGVARVRYEFETEERTYAEVKDAAGHTLQEAFTEQVTVSEDAPLEYYHWQDVLWGWGRSFAELPWIAFRSYLSKDEVKARFPGFEDRVEYHTQKVGDNDEWGGEHHQDAPWQKAEIWEIWDKATRKVVWYSKGCPKLLDEKDDPLQLSNFYPCPPFLIANNTTTLYKPTADYHLAQDSYNEVDRLQTRIAIITEAVKVVGVYDARANGVQRMLKEGVENDLIPVDEWAMFADEGGMQGHIDWFPVEQVVGTLDKLRQLRDETIALLQQTSGMADVMRGELRNQYEGAAQTEMKAHFGSIRVQALQDQFACFVGDLMQLKAEVICRHFEPETIAKLANMQYSMDKELVPQAIQLLKQPEMAHIRVKVRPETLAMEDFARLKGERTEFLTALATFMQSAAPLIDQDKASMPYLLKMLQWTMAGFKGSNEIEGILDKAIEGTLKKLAEEAKNPKPDPEAQKQQGEMAKIQAKSQADMQLRQQDLQADMQTVQAQHQAKITEIMATHKARMAEINAKMQADAMKEQAQLESNIASTQAAAAAEVEKDVASAEIDIAKSTAETELELEAETEKSIMEIETLGAQSSAKIDEMIVQADLKPEPKNETD